MTTDITTLTYYENGRSKLSKSNDRFIFLNEQLGFEGSTADDNETVISVADPTSNNVITLPDATGTVLLDSQDIDLADNKKIKLGNDGDLQIFHDGTNSIIKDTADSGGATIKYLAGTQTFQNKDANKTMAVFNANGAIDLHHNGTKKFETTASGIEIHGTIGITNSGSTYTLPTSDGSENQVLQTNGSGALSFATISSGGIASVSADDTPQLGGNLDVNGNKIVGGNGELIIESENGDGNIDIRIASNNTSGEHIFIRPLGTNSRVGIGSVFSPGSTEPSYPHEIRFDKSSSNANSQYISRIWNTNSSQNSYADGLVIHINNGFSSLGTNHRLLSFKKGTSSSIADFTGDGNNGLVLNVNNNYEVDASGDITLDAGGRNIYFQDSGSSWIDFQGSNSTVEYNGAITHKSNSNITLDAGTDSFVYFKESGSTMGGFDFGNGSESFPSFKIGTIDDNSTDRRSALYVKGNRSSAIAFFENVNSSTTCDGIKIKIGNTNGAALLDDPVSGGGQGVAAFIVFEKGDGTNQGYIQSDGSGGVELQNAFTGKHPTVIQTGESIVEGLIVESNGNLWASQGASTSIPKVTVSNANNSKKVFGVISSTSSDYEGYVATWGVGESESQITVNSIGEGKVWVTNINGNIENGDYVTTSEISGYGRLQDDDLLHNYTVAKCTEAVDWSSVTDTINHNGVDYKKHLIGCTYHCG